MNEIDVEGAITHALQRLASELSPELTYHSLSHTRDEVIPAAERLARLAGLDEYDRGLLVIAAAFHDVGFTENVGDHELASVRIAAQVLPSFGLDRSAIHRVRGMIVATRLPQSPRHLLECLLTDADLDGLARETFPARSAALLAERRALGRCITDEQWWREQLSFLRAHHYWTSYARESLAEGKARNISLLQQRLGIGAWACPVEPVGLT